ncbi:MAG: ATP-binding protein [Bacilli bacterium]|nr:ATP-binding protein [Bacilli bacterium]
MDIKTQIAPKGLEFKPDGFVSSDKHSTILTVISYPKIISPGFLASLTSMAGIKMVAKHIPLPFDVISKMINKEIADLKVRYQEERDLTIQEKIRQDYESLEAFIKQLAASQAKIYDFQLHLLITADSKDELTAKKLQLKSYLEAMEMKAVPLRFEQETVLKSMLPIFPKQEIEERIGTPIPAPTLAAMYPYVFDSVKDPGLSTLLGVDFSGGIVLFNQFLYQTQKEHNRNNANMILLGTSGSGKSTAAKLLIRSHIRNDYKIVIIDPEGEFEDMTRLYGGDFIDLGKGGDFGMINPLEVIIDADEEEIKQGMGYAVLTRSLQTVKAFMKYYDPSITEDILNVFSGVVQETYKRFGIDFNTDFTNFSSKDYPTIKDVYATVKGKITAMPEQNKEREILENLELKLRPLISELRYYFDGKTTISPKSNFIVFNIRELMNADENIRNALFFNVLKYAWSLTLDVNINTILTVDEAHVLLSGKNTLGAEFLAQVQRRARKYNTGTIIITQQPTDFSDPAVITQGKAIFDNASYYLVMGLRKQATADLAKLIDLNDNEIESIKGFTQGQALFVCGSKRMTIDIVVTEQELDSFGSGGGL